MIIFTDEGIDVRSVLESMTTSMAEEVMKSDAAAADIQKISEAGKGASPFESVELMSEFISSSECAKLLFYFYVEVLVLAFSCVPCDLSNI